MKDTLKNSRSIGRGISRARLVSVAMRFPKAQVDRIVVAMEWRHHIRVIAANIFLSAVIVTGRVSTTAAVIIAVAIIAVVIPPSAVVAVPAFAAAHVEGGE